MSALPNNDIQYIVRDGQRTHVVLPIAEYLRLTGSDADDVISDADNRINDPNTRWLSTSELASSLAWSRIAAARNAKGISQQTLADRTGLNQTRISRIERDPGKAKLEDLQKIAAALGLDIETLIRTARDTQA